MPNSPFNNTFSRRSRGDKVPAYFGDRSAFRGALRRPFHYRRVVKCLSICLLHLLWVPVERGFAADGPNLGPLFDTFPLTLESGNRTEVLGPVFYSEQAGSQRVWAFPPLLSRAWDPETDFDEIDFGYPLMTYRRYGKEYRWQFVQVFSFAGGRDQQERDSRRLTLFPLYFQQRSADPARNYTALFPVYGHLQNRLLLRDKIFFVMFPIYSQTWKKDVVTDNYLYPLFHLRSGDGLRGWQFWPVTGHEHKEPTLRTNGFGDTERISGYDEKFLLWPLFFNTTSGVGSENPRKEQTLLPFYSYLRSPHRDSTTVIWPLFTHVTDRENHYREWETPWPLIVFARGEGKTTSRVWPFFSHAQNTNQVSDFYLWPVYKYNRLHAGALDRERTRILFFLYSDIIRKNTETGAAQRRTDVWPFFTRSRDYSGKSRLQIFAPLEPLVPFSSSIERDFSPLWSVWRAEENPRTGATSQSLLWNLYRRDATPESRKCSLLFGLFQYQSGSAGKCLRLFYAPVVNTRPAAAAHSK